MGRKINLTQTITVDISSIPIEDVLEEALDEDLINELEVRDYVVFNNDEGSNSLTRSDLEFLMGILGSDPPGSDGWGIYEKLRTLTYHL